MPYAPTPIGEKFMDGWHLRWTPPCPTTISRKLCTDFLVLLGMALCCFDSAQALRENMHSSAEGKRQITQDILTFADTQNPPRKIVAEVAKSESS
jgi:hypothetical protein